MIAQAPETKDFVPCPDGEQNAVCVDIVDLGNKTGFEGKIQHKCRLVFEVAALMEDGRRFTVGQIFTVSLAETANLRKFLEKWRNKPFTKEELAGFDLEKLLGAPARVIVSQSEGRDGKVYANVDGVLPARKEAKLLSSGEYTRVKDRDNYAPPADSPWIKLSAPDTQLSLEEDDIPF